MKSKIYFCKNDFEKYKNKKAAWTIIAMRLLPFWNTLVRRRLWFMKHSHQLTRARRREWRPSFFQFQFQVRWGRHPRSDPLPSLHYSTHHHYPRWSEERWHFMQLADMDRRATCMEWATSRLAGPTEESMQSWCSAGRGVRPLLAFGLSGRLVSAPRPTPVPSSYLHLAFLFSFSILISS